MGYFSRIDKAANLMTGLAERLGRSPLELDAGLTQNAVLQYRHMIMRCAACRHYSDCEALQKTHHRLSAAPAYCLNKAELDRRPYR